MKPYAIYDLRFVAEPGPGDVVLDDAAADLLRQQYEKIRQLTVMPEDEAVTYAVSYGISTEAAKEDLARIRRAFERDSPSETRTVAVKRPVS